MKTQRLNAFSDQALTTADAVGVTTNGVIKQNGLAVMGAGVALAAKRKFPGIDALLASKLKSNGNHVSSIRTTSGCVVFSFPTKDDWKNPSTLSLIERSAKELVTLTNLKGWKNVYLPRPGCACGGLSWIDVEPILDRHLDERFTIVYL